MLEQYKELGKGIKQKKNLLFANVFIQENLLHAIVDRNSEISSKQWLLMAVCKSFSKPQDLSTLAKYMGCSRQNVKKLALQLEKKGYISLVKSVSDARSICVEITEKGWEFSQSNTAMAESIHNALFQYFSDEDIDMYFELSMKMIQGIENLECFFKEKDNEKYNTK